MVMKWVTALDSGTLIIREEVAAALVRANLRVVLAPCILMELRPTYPAVIIHG
jgi:hypothetical protein